MLKHNQKNLPLISLQASVTPPAEPPYMGLFLSDGGTGIRMSGSGGICYNFKVGDRIADVLGCHIAPGVCIKSTNDGDGALISYAAAGTPVTLLDGKNETKGYVLGRCSGFAAGTLVAVFEEDKLRTFTGDERFLLYCQSCGLKLTDYPDIVCSIDPGLLDRLLVKEENGRLLIPVKHILPERLAGSLGGDMLSVMLRDKGDYEAYHLDTLRFGDLVMFTDIDATYGTAFLEGAVTIGVVSDGDSPHAGGGPSVTVLFSSKDQSLGGYLSEAGNIGCYYQEVK